MYGKIFRQIYNSSIANNWKTRVVFMDLIVLADSDGVVDMTVESIAATTRYPIEMIKEAISALEAPDPESRTSLQEGKRLMKLDQNRSWGWQIVNYLAYRDMKAEIDRKSYIRNYMRGYRKKNKKPSVNSVNSESLPVNTSPSPCTYIDRGTGGNNGIFEFRKTIGDMYGRKESDRWTYLEEQELSSVHTRENHSAELEEIKAFRERMDDRRFFPGSVMSLLNGWQQILDRARTSNHPNKQDSEAAEKAISMFLPKIPKPLRNEHNY